MLLDPSIVEQTYVEDCEVCCNPIEVTAAFYSQEMQMFDAQSLEQ